MNDSDTYIECGRPGANLRVPVLSDFDTIPGSNE